MFSESITTAASRLRSSSPIGFRDQKKSPRPAFLEEAEMVDTLFIYSKSSVGYKNHEQMKGTSSKMVLKKYYDIFSRGDLQEKIHRN